MNNEMNFSFLGKDVRMFNEEGKVFFCGKDVCDLLLYLNSRKAIKDHCRPEGVTKMDTVTDGGTQSMIYINEGNLYRLIIKSHLPEAQRFESLVCDEILPSIRKYGYYGNMPYTVRPHGYFHPEAQLNPEERRRLLALHPDWQIIYDLYMLGLNGNEIADKTGGAKTTVYNKISRMRRNGILPHPKREAAILEARCIALTKLENSELLE